MGVGGGVVDRHASRLRGAADAAVARGESSNAEVQTLWEAPLPRYANLALAAAFIVFIYLMVAKPGL
jgi:uncharacterized membrane protein